MAKSIIKASFTVILAAAISVLTALFVFPEKTVQKNSKAEQRNSVFELRRAFRNASAVVEGVCINSYTSPYGSIYSDYSVERVVSGKNIGEGDMITVLSSDTPGQRRLIYLSHAIGDVHSENSEVYSVVEGGFLSFENGEVAVSDDMSIPLEFIERDVVSLRSEIRIPSKYYFYGDAQGLVNNCTSVFIGRIEKIVKHTDSELYVMDRGEIIKKTGEDCELCVRVLDGMMWQHNSGDRVSVRLAIGGENGLINYETNECFIPEKEASEPIEGGVYVFFVKSGPDEKAEHFFLVNPCQGFIGINGENISVCELNTAFCGVSSVDELMAILIKASGMPTGFVFG